MATLTTKKVALKKFNVIGHMWVDVGIEITASNLAEAVEKTKELKYSDFITIDGEYQESSDVRITSIWESYVPLV